MVIDTTLELKWALSIATSHSAIRERIVTLLRPFSRGRGAAADRSVTAPSRLRTGSSETSSSLSRHHRKTTSTVKLPTARCCRSVLSNFKVCPGSAGNEHGARLLADVSCSHQPRHRLRGWSRINGGAGGAGRADVHHPVHAEMAGHRKPADHARGRLAVRGVGL